MAKSLDELMEDFDANSQRIESAFMSGAVDAARSTIGKCRIEDLLKMPSKEER